MKNFPFLVLLLCFTVINVFSQSSFELTFTAGNNGQNVQLDSILIENITQNVDTMLYTPDTVLVLDYITDLDVSRALIENDFTLTQNYPNPFSDQTTINVFLTKMGNVEINIHDILGRKVGNYENTLDKGKHTFKLYPGNEQVYFLHAKVKDQSRTIKMLNSRNISIGGGSCKIVYSGHDEIPLFQKSQRIISDFVYNLGDHLRYIGYAKTVMEVKGSCVIEDAPLDNEIYELEITEGTPCPDIPILNYGGQDYLTVQIGDQCWFKENLNYGVMISGSNEMTDNGIAQKYCFDDEPQNCIDFGGLYQWNEIMNYSSENGAQGLCPDGWHLPTDEEWKILEGTVDSQYPADDPVWDNVMFRGFDACLNLKSTTGWELGCEGTNLFGFTALPIGYRGGDGDGGFYSEDACLWSSTEYSSVQRPWWRWITDSERGVYRGYSLKDYGYSVRCIKD